MKDEHLIVNLDGNKQYDAVLEEVVYYEPSAYQYDEGALFFIEEIDEMIFVSNDGNVYKAGTSQLIGVCHEIKRRADEYGE